jgi:nicotinate-nucleotide adenylyltransferase
VFFGTFDVFHNGHRAMADAALEEGGLESLIVVPALAPPNKYPHTAANAVQPPVAPAFDYRHRLAMAQLACADNKRLVVSDIESRLPVPSYSINTLRALFPDFDQREPHSIAFLSGLDTYISLGHWAEAECLISQLHFMVVPRHQSQVPPTLILNGRNVPHHPSLQVIETFRDDTLAATALKPLIQSGQLNRLAQAVPAPVLDYIKTQLLVPTSGHREKVDQARLELSF